MVNFKINGKELSAKSGTTTPRMMAEMKKGNLVAFSNAVTPYTLTSNVMKEMLSMHSVDQEGSMVRPRHDAPL